ncbi:hypothetical protein TcCL_ESM09943, partial [Trypanosoma cruzi]
MKREGRTVQREHTATVITSSSRSHAWHVVIRHASAHTEQRPHKKKNQQDKKHTAALHSRHALPPVVLLLSLPTHPHIAPHSRRILRRRTNSGRNTSDGAAAGLKPIRNNPRHQNATPPMGSTPRKSRSQHGNKTIRGHPSSLLARAAAATIVYVRASSAITPPHSVRNIACASASAFGSVYTCRAAVQHKRVP